jgi:hypothetical protein
VTQYLLFEDRLRQSFGEDFLLDLEVPPWCGDMEHDKPGYFLFHGMLPMPRALLTKLSPPIRIKRSVTHAAYINPFRVPLWASLATPIAGKFSTFLL